MPFLSFLFFSFFPNPCDRETLEPNCLKLSPFYLSLDLRVYAHTSFLFFFYHPSLPSTLWNSNRPQGHFLKKGPQRCPTGGWHFLLSLKFWHCHTAPRRLLASGAPARSPRTLRVKSRRKHTQVGVRWSRIVWALFSAAKKRDMRRHQKESGEKRLLNAPGL